ncbi:hypothetical protein [Roseomonas elaeocarpi]|uniref:Phage tail protein n=1 Tax=Roseomonas elaeocarpi TaxID=907779 RepID=A0ABV6JUH1_9PROT
MISAKYESPAATGGALAALSAALDRHSELLRGTARAEADEAAAAKAMAAAEGAIAVDPEGGEAAFQAAREAHARAGRLARSLRAAFPAAAAQIEAALPAAAAEQQALLRAEWGRLRAGYEKATRPLIAALASLKALELATDCGALPVEFWAQFRLPSDAANPGGPGLSIWGEDTLKPMSSPQIAALTESTGAIARAEKLLDAEIQRAEAARVKAVIEAQRAGRPHPEAPPPPPPPAIEIIGPG